MKERLRFFIAKSEDMQGYLEGESQEERSRRRRREIRRRRKRRRAMRIILTRWVPFLVICLVVVALLVSGVKTLAKVLSGNERSKADIETVTEENNDTVSLNDIVSENTVSEDTVSEDTAEPEPIQNLEPIDDGTAGAVPGDVVSEHALLISLSENKVIAGRDYNSVINPASMTKVLTVLVAAEKMEENGDDLDTKFTMTEEIENFSYVHECSNVGFSVGEVITMKDLFYGTILPSGGDAAYSLAVYAGGSMDGFAELMNAKLKEIGCSENAHFTNSIGLYDENHHCTTMDMAKIMYAAMQNDLCKEVLSAHKYTTSKTAEHPDGIEISNWFLRRIEDKDTNGIVVAAKTGFVIQSKNCAVSYAQDNYGNPYICVTGGSSSSWRCIYDHVSIYKRYLN